MYACFLGTMIAQQSQPTPAPAGQEPLRPELPSEQPPETKLPEPPSTAAPPTVGEAVAAARGLTDDLQEQIEIAASLMDLPPDQVRPEVLKAATSRKDANTVAFVGRAGAPRTVVVERVPSRRPIAGKPVATKGLAGKRIGR